MHCRRTNILHFSMNISNFAKETIYLLECLVAGWRLFSSAHTTTSNHVEWCCKTPFRHFWQCMMSSWEGGGGAGKTFFCYVWGIIALFTLLKRRGVKKKLLESIMPQLWLVYAQFFSLSSPAFTLHVRIVGASRWEPIIGVIGSD